VKSAIAHCRPRFGQLVVLGETRYRVAAVMAPARGYLVSPEGAEDASADQLLTLGDWSVLRFDPRAERWEAA
jgi:hypothetical protein